MTDAEFATQKQRVRVLLKKWRLPLGLEGWRLAIEYQREDFKPDEGAAANWQVVGRCSVKWEYLDARIVFAMPAVAALDDAALEETFVHECCHILVNELKHVTDDFQCHEERVTTVLARAFRGAWADGQAAGRKQQNERKAG